MLENYLVYLHDSWRSTLGVSSWKHLVYNTFTIVLHSVVSAKLLDTLLYFISYCLYKMSSFKGHYIDVLKQSSFEVKALCFNA